MNGFKDVGSFTWIVSKHVCFETGEFFGDGASFAADQLRVVTGGV